MGAALPPPRSVEEVVQLSSCVSSSSHSHSQSLPTRRQEAQSSSFSHTVSRSVVRHGSESDRPDSGFDSIKDDREEEGGAGAAGAVRSLVTVRDEAGTSSSPETVREISRQGVARQPLKKKRNLTHH